MPRFFWYLIGLACVSSSVLAQGATDIHLVPIVHGDKSSEVTAESVTHLGPPSAVTDRDGYDNQPAFLPDGETLVYTSIEGEQADIWRFDLGSGKRLRVTESPESEYSPTPIPGDPDGLSVVRVEADGTQRLWRVPLGDGEASLLLPDIAPVGYHAWSDEDRLALFVLGEPPTLQLAKRGPGTGSVLAEDIGRAIARIPGGTDVSFVHKKADGWRIVRAQLTESGGELSDIVAARPEREDYAWDPDGALWMADGTAIYRHRPGTDTDWIEIGDLADHGITGTITRLAVSPDGRSLAVVAERSQGTN